MQEQQAKNTIKNKKEFYESYEKGVFGNRALAWNNYEDFLARTWKGMICIRSKSGFSRKMVRYNVLPEDVEKTLVEFEKAGFSRDRLAFNQSMPDEHLLIQGEVMRSSEGLHLTYTTAKKPMNIGLKEEEIKIDGIGAMLLLRGSLWPTSYDDLIELLDIFSNNDLEPSCVVEFSSYRVAVGNLPHRNTVFWEVRNY